jgi:hypothetical protein
VKQKTNPGLALQSATIAWRPELIVALDGATQGRYTAQRVPLYPLQEAHKSC